MTKCSFLGGTSSLNVIKSKRLPFQHLFSWECRPGFKISQWVRALLLCVCLRVSTFCLHPRKSFVLSYKSRFIFNMPPSSCAVYCMLSPHLPTIKAGTAPLGVVLVETFQSVLAVQGVRYERDAVFKEVCLALKSRGIWYCWRQKRCKKIGHQLCGYVQGFVFIFWSLPLPWGGIQTWH